MQITTDHESDRWYYLTWGIRGGLEKWFVIKGEAEHDLFSRPYNPQNPLSQIVSLLPEGLVIICFVLLQYW